jgi:hypothetical protein
MKDRESPTFYDPGSNWVIDDISGFRVRAEDARIQWNGLLVDKVRWEARNPQDFVKGVVDDQNVPDPRPRAPATFVQLQGVLYSEGGEILDDEEFGEPLYAESF